MSDNHEGDSKYLERIFISLLDSICIINPDCSFPYLELETKEEGIIEIKILSVISLNKGDNDGNETK